MRTVRNLAGVDQLTPFNRRNLNVRLCRHLLFRSGNTESTWDPGHLGYLVSATGTIRIDDVQINARDGDAIKDVDVIRVTALEDSEIVMVDAA
ncbi:hypothetical protein [Novosphingobium sp.]|uniref:pirin family protein n=1 Tax=Novosphingobium sp. TaxID=1874826 RepID=UPI0028AFA8C2|nr:hypothetical protein [Novosphingobium sp.]